MKTHAKSLLLASMLGLALSGCSKQTQTTADTAPTADATQPPVTMAIDYQKMTLDNGLQVVFHQDHSDPVVAVALTVHVGSAREKPNRTGFAHLFEHLLFLESENLGKGGLDKLSARIGGSGANGSTSRDRTNYFQTVPKDALEKMLWAEADKLGWFINTVTEPVLAKEKQVVKNEKRQGVDNRPYGHTWYVIGKNLYPQDHPYNWQVIGSLQDLQAATLADVKEFFHQWYVPNNTTLVIAGDFDLAQAKQWVRKYFDEIPRGEDIARLQPRPVTLDSSKQLMHEDNFAKQPELTMVWPTVEQYHPDSYALDVLAEYLAEGKQAPFYEVLVKEDKVTAATQMFNFSTELTGEFHLSVRAFADTDLDTVAASVNSAFARFEKDGISQQALERIKASQETAFYQSLSSVLGKGFQLAQYNIFAEDPGFVEQDIANLLKVTSEDVIRVYQQYIKGKHYVATSFVPKGHPGLALEGSQRAEVTEEQILAGAEQEVDPNVDASYVKTPSTFDRSIEPAYGQAPVINPPSVWQQQLDNGLDLYGIVSHEVPLVHLTLTLPGGKLLDPAGKSGTSHLVAGMLSRGTSSKTAAEFEAAIKQLGASLEVDSGHEQTQIQLTSLSRNFTQSFALLQQMLLQPGWDPQEFELLKSSVVDSLKQQQANPNAIAENQFQMLLYGKEDPRAQNVLGNESSLSVISLQDLKQYHQQVYTPRGASLHVVGDIEQAELVAALASLNQQWHGEPVVMGNSPLPAKPAQAKVYFYDVPDAKQSVLRIGRPALKATEKDYYNVRVMNYRLGGGGFASQLTQQLREGKGYTYGIRSGFNGGSHLGQFVIGSGVRTNVTYPSSQLIKDILSNYADGFGDQDLATTKSFMIKSTARAFETAGAKLRMLHNISQYQWPTDYVTRQMAQVEQMTVADVQALARQYVDPNSLIWLVVGDAKSQLKEVEKLGFGAPVLIK